MLSNSHQYLFSVESHVSLGFLGSKMCSCSWQDAGCCSKAMPGDVIEERGVRDRGRSMCKNWPCRCGFGKYNVDHGGPDDSQCAPGGYLGTEPGHTGMAAVEGPMQRPAATCTLPLLSCCSGKQLQGLPGFKHRCCPHENAMWALRACQEKYQVLLEHAWLSFQVKLLKHLH